MSWGGSRDRTFPSFTKSALIRRVSPVEIGKKLAVFWVTLDSKTGCLGPATLTPQLLSLSTFDHRIQSLCLCMWTASVPGLIILTSRVWGKEAVLPRAARGDCSVGILECFMDQPESLQHRQWILKGVHGKGQVEDARSEAQRPHLWQCFSYPVVQSHNNGISSETEKGKWCCHHFFSMVEI